MCIRDRKQAEEGIKALQKVVDTLIIIPNQNLFRLANESTTFTEAFSMADDVLYQGVKGVTDLMVRPGLINLDFADVRAIMDEMGKAMMGTGEGEGEERALKASEKAIANPLLDEISLSGAKGVLINITGGNDLTLFELDEAANRIREEVDPNANIIVGSTLDTSLDGKMRVSVVATGIDVGQVANVPIVEQVNTSSNSKSELEEELAESSENVEPFLFKDLENTSDVDKKNGTLSHAKQSLTSQDNKVVTSVDIGSNTTDSDFHLQESDTKAFGLENTDEDKSLKGHPRTEKKKFGINSLIGRMTNNVKNNENEVSSVISEGPDNTNSTNDSSFDDEDERIEIPAFLRRQAN